MSGTKFGGLTNGRCTTLWTYLPLNGVQEVGGSNPLALTIFRECEIAPPFILDCFEVSFFIFSNPCAILKMPD